MRYGTIGVGAPGADATGYGPNRITLNLPTENFNKIDGDNGFWVTDRMTYKRATITAGLRFDWFLGSVGDSASPAEQMDRRGDLRGLRRLAQLEGSQSAARLRVRFVRQRENGAESRGFEISERRDGQHREQHQPDQHAHGDDQTLPGLTATGTTPSSIPTAQCRTRTSETAIPTQDELAPIPPSSTFGQLVPSTTITDPKVRNGFGSRGYSWEFSGGVQHELLPRLSVSFNYYHRPTNRQPRHHRQHQRRSGALHRPVLRPRSDRPTSPPRWRVAVVRHLAAGAGGVQHSDAECSDVHEHAPRERQLRSLKRITYNHGYDLTVNARTPFGTLFQGGINADQSVNDTLLPVGDREPAKGAAQSDHRRALLPRRDAIPARREVHRCAAAALVGAAALGHVSECRRARCGWRTGRSRRPLRSRTGG